MSNTTYDELSAKIQTWMDDNDAEFVGSIDDIINLGEMRLWRDLDLTIFTSTQTADSVSGNGTLTKPTGDLELVNVLSLSTVSAGERIYLELRSIDWIRDYRETAPQAVPRYYAEDNETDWQLGPIPDAVYTFDVRGTTRPARLSSGNQTNWLSLHQDDMLFKACLAESEGYLKDDERVGLWQGWYADALPLAKKETYELLESRYQLTGLQSPGQPTAQR